MTRSQRLKHFLIVLLLVFPLFSQLPEQAQLMTGNSVIGATAVFRSGLFSLTCPPGFAWYSLQSLNTPPITDRNVPGKECFLVFNEKTNERFSIIIFETPKAVPISSAFIRGIVEGAKESVKDKGWNIEYFNFTKSSLPYPDANEFQYKAAGPNGKWFCSGGFFASIQTNIVLFVSYYSGGEITPPTFSSFATSLNIQKP